MDTILKHSAGPQAAPVGTREAVAAFLSDLGELSRKHSLAVGDGGTVYMMEQDDFCREYSIDNESILSFV